MRSKPIDDHALLREFVEIPHLEVYEDVLDVPVNFEFEEVNVRIVVPDLRKNSKTQSTKPEKTGTTTWANGESLAHFWAPTIELTVTSSEELDLPKNALKVHPRRENEFTKKQVMAFDAHLERLQIVGNHALALWLETCRWVTGCARFGDTPRSFYAYLPDPYLKIASTDHRFWCLLGAPTRVLHILPPVSLEHWKKVENRLQEGNGVPVWYSYIFEAQNRYFRRDYSGALLVAAIACETLIRHCLICELESPESKAAVSIVDSVSIRSILSKLAKFETLEFDEEAYSIRMLHRLFDLRNGEVHSASLGPESHAELIKLIDNAKAFIDFVHPQV